MGVTERDRILAVRRAVRDAFGHRLWDEVSAILFEDDPIHINFGSNTDEYEPEVETILPRLAGCSGPGDAQRVVFQEVERWFGVGQAGRFERYEALSHQVWNAWIRREVAPLDVLGRLMSDLSETCWSAGWLEGTEYLVPELCRRAVERDEPQPWGQGEVAPALAKALAVLAGELRHWANLDARGAGYVAFDPFPVPQACVDDLDHWLVRRDRRGPARQ